MKKLVSIVVAMVFLMGSLSWLGCAPKQPPPEVKSEEPKFKVEPLEPSKNIVVKVEPPTIRKPMAKKPAVTKVTKEGNVYTLKLNTKLKPGQEVHLCIGYLYFPVPANQVGPDGTAKIKVDWTPPGNPRVTAGVYVNGAYVTSMLVSAGG